jgi:hypothetical protein
MVFVNFVKIRIFLLITFLFSLKRLFDYLSWSDNKIQYIEKSIVPSPSLVIKENKFAYAIRLTFDNDTSLHNSSLSDFFSVSHSHVIQKDGEGKKKNTNLPRPCTDSDFYGKSSNYSIFSRTPLDDFDCFEISANDSLKGIYTDSEMRYSEILLKINPSYYTNFSYVEEVFKNYQFKLTLYYIDTFNDVSNFETPVFYKIDALYTYLDLAYFKRINVNFQEFSFSEDENLFYNNYKNSKYMKLFTSQEIIAPIQDRANSPLDDKQNLAKFILRAVNNQKEVKLSFVKIPELLASLAGLLVNLLVVMKIVMEFLNLLEAKQNVMNKIMKYKDVIKQNNKNTLDYLATTFQEHRSRRSSLDSNENKKLKNEEKLELKNTSINNLDDPMLVSTKNSINPYKIGFIDYICLALCCRSVKKRRTIFENAEKKFNHNIDLITFMKKMQEVEILKYLVLDKNTLELVNFISKPSISLSNEQISDEEYLKFFDDTKNTNTINTESIDTLKVCYDNIVSKENNTSVEKRILKLFDIQIQEILK